MVEADVVILGAGIAGLMAACQFREAGLEAVLVDKSRGAGGRMATRRIGEAVLDHGAQFFSVRYPAFRAYVDTWLEEGAAVEWSRGWQRADGHPRYRGSKGMTSVPKHLAGGLNIHLSEKVERIDRQEGAWIMRTEKGSVFEGRGLVMTAPVPQGLALLDAGSWPVPEELRAPLERITYDPCFALLLVLNRPAEIPAPGGMQLDDPVFDWIGDNQQKGISPVPALTLHAGAAFTRAYFEAPPDEVAGQLIRAASKWVPEDAIAAYQIQRWRYSKPDVLHPERFLLHGHPPIVFAGDAFYEPRVEGAALSGMAAAQALLELLE